LGTFWSIELHSSVPSTQDLIKQAAAQHVPEGLVAQALTQTAGRGRHGRTWVSDAGNLYLSLLLRPRAHAENLGELSLMTAVALVQAIDHRGIDEGLISLKWPNDILLDRQKCAGILVETDIVQDGRINWVVIGVGVNLSSAPPDIAHALNDYADQPLHPDDLRDRFLENLHSLYQQWTNEGFQPIKKAWLARAHKPGAALSVKIGDDTQSGLFSGIDDRGGLILEIGGALKTITAGDVFLED
jgi:BirA family biotin operon repressor/biotin-[acetyl-CoA-carboxylase] ligase